MDINNPDDVQRIVQVAQDCKGFTKDECIQHREADKLLTVGFGHDAILANAGTVITITFLFMIYAQPNETNLSQ